MPTMRPSRTIGLVVEEERLGVVGGGTGGGGGSRPASRFASTASRPMKSPFAGFDGEAEAGFEDVVLVGDVVAEVAVGLLDAAAVEGVEAAEPEAGGGARFLQRLEGVGGLVGGDVELPAELADVGDAVGAGETHAELDLASGAEGEARRWRSRRGWRGR